MKVKITTSSGKTFDADWTLKTRSHHGADLLVIQLPGETMPGEIVEGLVGESMIQELKVDGKCVPHEGYTLLYSIIYTHNRKAVRVTLEKGDAA